MYVCVCVPSAFSGNFAEYVHNDLVYTEFTSKDFSAKGSISSENLDFFFFSIIIM